ncbi:helix-turn-helix domain-containing protein [Virgibacillus doumboii]|uniref:helix-turn-helix domain-containing protein n=1 Tax=Virgibacillus doumboii TaxID=2697503 RepID=UPI0013E0308F|nr:helix-turn-helix domain-containing protein [Virgibacillus doumboii]
MDNYVTDIFKALAHTLRREILDLLSEKPMTTSEISKQFQDVSRYAIMKHLNTLEEANLVVSRKTGRQKYNYLNAVPLQEVNNRWLTNYTSSKAQSLLRIKNITESEKGEDMMSETLARESFRIEQEVSIQASAEDVFAAITKNIDAWWSERLFKDSYMELDPSLGGSFIEKGSNGKVALWGTITYIVPNTEVWLDGVLGMQGPINSFYKYKLEENGGLTKLMLSHAVSGPVEPEWEEQYREGWKNLLTNKLKQYLES